MSLVDAMATGMPVVSTRHSDIPEIVIDGVNGFLSDENNIDDFAQTIEDVITTNKLSELSINARAHVEAHFDTKIQARKLENLYSELIKNN
jgi:colanic acid/amylovoran biosynthesis glycosyltransferase